MPLFADRGLAVAPLKSQNMALNSFVTEDGGEIARSIALQAAAARQVPNVHMNPLLLKPKSDDTSQLIVHGKAWGEDNTQGRCRVGRHDISGAAKPAEDSSL